MAAEGIEMVERMTHDLKIEGITDFTDVLGEMDKIMKEQDSMQNIQESLKDTDKIFEESNPFVFDGNGELVKDTEGNPKLKFKGGEYSLQEIYKMETGEKGSTSENISGKPEAPDLVKQTKALLGESGWEELSPEIKNKITESGKSAAKTWRDLPDTKEAMERSKGNDVAKDLNKDEKTKVEDRPTEATDIEEWNKKTDKAMEESGQKKNAESTLEKMKKAGGVLVGKIFKYSYRLAGVIVLYDLYKIVDDHAKAMSGCWLICSDGSKWKILPLTCSKYQEIEDNQGMAAVVSYKGWADQSGVDARNVIRPSDLNTWNPCPKDPGTPLFTYCLDADGSGNYFCGGDKDKGSSCGNEEEACEVGLTKTCKTCVDAHEYYNNGVYYSKLAYPGGLQGYDRNCANELVNTDQGSSCENGSIRDGKCDKNCDVNILDIPRPLADGRTFSIQCIEASWLDSANDLFVDALTPVTDFTTQLFNIIKMIVIVFVVIWLVIFFGKIIFKQLFKK